MSRCRLLVTKAGKTLTVITLLLVLTVGLAVLAAGEAVRGQCRRMLARPVVISPAVEPASGARLAGADRI